MKQNFIANYERTKTEILICPEKKEKVTDVEQQLKKAEAADRPRLKNEKAASESPAFFVGL